MSPSWRQAASDDSGPCGVIRSVGILSHCSRPSVCMLACRYVPHSQSSAASHSPLQIRMQRTVVKDGALCGGLHDRANDL